MSRLKCPACGHEFEKTVRRSYLDPFVPEMLKLRAEGKQYIEIARIIMPRIKRDWIIRDWSLACLISTVLSHHGVPKTKSYRVPSGRNEKIVEMRERGEKYKVIGEHFGISAGWARYIFERARRRKERGLIKLD